MKSVLLRHDLLSFNTSLFWACKTRSPSIQPPPHTLGLFPALDWKTILTVAVGEKMAAALCGRRA